MDLERHICKGTCSQPSHEIENWKDVSHEKFETQGVEIFHFQDGKIKEAWTIFGSMDSLK